MKYYAAQMCDKGTLAVDDTLLVKDVEATAGSRILEGFKPLFSAEAVVRLENAGYTVAGKTHVGEFGLDLVGEFSHYAPQTEGKLKGAAASLVAEGGVKAALGVDLNGAPRRAAALSDVAFLKPTYGTVSRYGVMACACSGEQVGVYAKTAAEIAQVMAVIAGHDDKDGTSLRDEHYDYTLTAVDGKRVALVKELYDVVDDAVKARIDAAVEALKASGVTVETVSCDLFEDAATAWQVLMTAETCNNVSRYDGVKYGHRSAQYKNIDELYVNSRTEGFNFLTKAVVLYGSDVLSKTRYADCYDKSLRVRRVMADKWNAFTDGFDAVLMPTCSKTAFEAYDIREAFGKVFAESKFTALANLIGCPALAAGGVQLMGKHFADATLLSLAAAVEKEGQ